MINHRIWEQSIIGMCWTSIPMHTETRTVRTAKGGVQAVLLDETGENEEREVKLQSFAEFFLLYAPLAGEREKHAVVWSCPSMSKFRYDLRSSSPWDFHMVGLSLMTCTQQAARTPPKTSKTRQRCGCGQGWQGQGLRFKEWSQQRLGSLSQNDISWYNIPTIRFKF